MSPTSDKKMLATFLPFLTIPAFFTLPLLAQIEEGKAAKYFSFDEAKGILDEYPALSLEDLRKITLYSGLVIKDAQAAIADNKYMRRIEPHFREKDVLVVTSDRFKFTVLKNAVIDPKALAPEEQPFFRFFWIKHETRELPPDKRPMLKDLLLLPYDAKKKKLLGPWPFQKKDPRRGLWLPCFLKAADPWPLKAKYPTEDQCVAGTFKSGKVNYLVIDVFGGYSWWDKVVYSEFFYLRGHPPADIEVFHKGINMKKGEPPWAMAQWFNPVLKVQQEIYSFNREMANAALKKLPALLQIAGGEEKSKDWEDLLYTEGGQAVKKIDELISDKKNFGDLIAWANVYLDRHWDQGFLHHWRDPLEKLLPKDDKSYIVTTRVLKYAFRSKGFLTQVLCIPEKQPGYPDVLLQIYFPSQNLIWIFDTYNRAHLVMEPSAALLSFPNLTPTMKGRLPVFDCHVSGPEINGFPIPSGKFFQR